MILNGIQMLRSCLLDCEMQPPTASLHIVLVIETGFLSSPVRHKTIDSSKQSIEEAGDSRFMNGMKLHAQNYPARRQTGWMSTTTESELWHMFGLTRKGPTPRRPWRRRGLKQSERPSVHRKQRPHSGCAMLSPARHRSGTAPSMLHGRDHRSKQHPGAQIHDQGASRAGVE